MLDCGIPKVVGLLEGERESRVSGLCGRECKQECSSLTKGRGSECDFAGVRLLLQGFIHKSGTI